MVAASLVRQSDKYSSKQDGSGAESRPEAEQLRSSRSAVEEQM